MVRRRSSGTPWSQQSQEQKCKSILLVLGARLCGDASFDAMKEAMVEVYGPTILQPPDWLPYNSEVKQRSPESRRPRWWHEIVSWGPGWLYKRGWVEPTDKRVARDGVAGKATEQRFVMTAQGWAVYHELANDSLRLTFVDAIRAEAMGSPLQSASAMVYVMGEPDSNLVKIGFTTGALDMRRQGVSAEVRSSQLLSKCVNPDAIIVHRSYEGSLALERYLHDEFKSYRSRLSVGEMPDPTEWFVFSSLEVALKSIDEAVQLYTPDD